MCEVPKMGTRAFCFLNQPPKVALIYIGLIPPFWTAQKRRYPPITFRVLVCLALAWFNSKIWSTGSVNQQGFTGSTAFTDKITSSLPVGLIATDKEGKIAFYNSSAKKITGIDLSNSIGKKFDDVLPANICQLQNDLSLGKNISEKEMKCEFTKQKIVPVSISASEIINEDGQFLGQVF